MQLKANVLGTEFLLRGRGGDPSLHKGFNAQLLAVNFKPTVNHVKAGPRTMTACVPVPEAVQVCTATGLWRKELCHELGVTTSCT
jgi:hypothetical protein